MAIVRKFLFDQTFEDGAGLVPPARPKPPPRPEKPQVEEPPPPPPPPPPPMFSEEELAAAREHSFEAGRVAGIHEAETATARMVATALSTLTFKLQEIDRRQAEAGEVIARDAVRVAHAVLARMVPGLLAQGACQEIEALVIECLQHLLDEARITVRVNENLVDDMRERLESVARQVAFEGRLLVVADSRLTLGDCRVEWSDGGAERTQDRLWQEIEAAIARALAPTPDADGAEA